MYLTPPHTTGIHQTLDQIFNTWHKTFNACVTLWNENNPGKELKKQHFTQIFAESWADWMVGKPDKIMAAWRHVGISIEGLNPNAIDKTKLVLSEMVVPQAEATTEVDTPALETTQMTTPSRRGGASLSLVRRDGARHAAHAALEPSGMAAEAR